MAAREADGRREQLRERASAGCVRPDGGGVGGGSSEAGRVYEGDGDGVMGCEGVDGLSNDRAGHARHEDPVLPSRDVNRTQLRAGL